MKESEQLVVALAGIAGAVGIGYVVVTKLIPGASSAQCTTPGSACYSALQPYAQEYQTCANQYAANLQAYLQENNANGTGLTSAQITNLNYLTQCMNQAAQNMAKVAQQYNVNPLAVLESWGTVIIEGALVIIGIKYLGPSLVTVLRSGATAASNALQSIVRGSVSNGTVTADSASALSLSLPSVDDTIQYYDQSLLDTLSIEGVITAEEATLVIDEDITNLVTDFTATIDELSSLA